MSETPDNGRKKTLIISLLVFLFLGGGVFVFFVFQGLGDLKGDTKANFSYGFSVRDAVVPVFEYFGLAENEASKVETTKKRIKARGLDASLLDEPQADISDWMAKGGNGGKGGRPSGSYSAPPVRTNVPKMDGGLSGPGTGGGGSSQSSANISRFGGGSGSGNVRISKTGRSGPEPANSRSGTLNALGNVRAALGEGLRSDSAMAAKSKWDQSFGVGVTGKKGGDLAYGKPGLVKLDHIKSGDIANLKTMDPKSLKVTEPGKPSKDTEGEDKVKKSSSTAFGEKDAAKSMIDAAGKGVSAGIQASGSGAKPDSQGPKAPPSDVLSLAMKPRSQGGSYCDAPEGCSCGEGCIYKDAKPILGQNPNGTWNVAYTGIQVKNGVSLEYNDVVTQCPSCAVQSRLAMTFENNVLVASNPTVGDK